MVSDECHHYGTHSTMSHCDKVIVPDRQRGHLQYTLQVGFFHQRSFRILPVISGTERKIKDQTQAMARRKIRGSLRAGNPGQEPSNGRTSVGQSTWAITALDSGKKKGTDQTSKCRDWPGVYSSSSWGGMGMQRGPSRFSVPLTGQMLRRGLTDMP